MSSKTIIFHTFAKVDFIILFASPKTTKKKKINFEID